MSRIGTTTSSEASSPVCANGAGIPCIGFGTFGMPGGQLRWWRKRAHSPCKSPLLQLHPRWQSASAGRKAAHVRRTPSPPLVSICFAISLLHRDALFTTAFIVCLRCRPVEIAGCSFPIRCTGIRQRGVHTTGLRANIHSSGSPTGLSHGGRDEPNHTA
jgi:hypothetical protein